MNYRRDSNSTITIDQTTNSQRFSSIFKRLLQILTHYDSKSLSLNILMKYSVFLLFLFIKAPKVVRFESKWIARLSLIVKLSLAIGCLILMCQRSAYQVFDRSPISVVTIKVKPSASCSRNSSIMAHFINYNCTQSIYDVNDFILPATENSAVSITIRITEIEHVLRYCNNTRIGKKQNKYSNISATAINKCSDTRRCILPPFYRDEYENATIKRKVQLCWFKLPDINIKRNYQALDYILFIKNFVEFPQLGLVRDNLIRDNLPKDYFDDCEYDPKDHPLCPKFRISKILEMLPIKSNEYELIFYHGSLIEIKINWKCNLDQNTRHCKPSYEFQRLDIQPYESNPYDPGSSFLTSKHFFRPNDRELHRVHTMIYNLHIIVSVTGETGKFDLFQTTTSIGSFLGIFGTGAIVCDLMAAFFTNFKRVKYDS